MLKIITKEKFNNNSIVKCLSGEDNQVFKLSDKCTWKV